MKPKPFDSEVFTVAKTNGKTNGESGDLLLEEAPSRTKAQANGADSAETTMAKVKVSKPVTSPAKPISLPDLDIREITIRIIGDSPLICHKWSEKAKKEMLNKQMGVATEGKEKKDPDRDYWESLYHLPGGKFGFPAIAFKAAAVTACTSLGKAITKVQARQAFHVIGEYVEIEGTPSPREDMVKIGMGTADIRFRGEFRQWACVVHVRYNARVLTQEQIVNLFNTAGFAVGVGEWRTERDGSFGMFHVARGDE